MDALVGDTFATPENVNSNLDVSELVAAARDTPCRVYAAVHALVDSDRLGQAAPEMIRACAHNAWQQGVDGLYLAHWFGMWPYEAPFYQTLRELPYPDIMSPKDKIYAVPTETQRYPVPGTEPGQAAPCRWICAWASARGCRLGWGTICTAGVPWAELRECCCGCA